MTQIRENRFSFEKTPLWRQWAAMLILSVVLIILLELLHLPAALLLGPLIAAVFLAINAGTPRLPKNSFFWAQGVIGCLIAQSFNGDLVQSVVENLPLFIISVLFVVVASTGLGYLLARWRILPGSTAVWGSSPGAASAMIILAAVNGADARLVAFMQYIRVALVAITASLIAHIFMDAPQQATQAVWFPATDWPALAKTILFIVVAVNLGRLTRLSSAPLLLPLFAGIALQATGYLTIELPPWLLALAYAIVGWSIGIGFTRSIITHAAKAFPKILASTLALILICGLYGALLSYLTGIDLLTAYLATSPGGADTMAIIAASSNVDMPFIMAMQTTRFFIVLLTGPALARFVVRKITQSRLAESSLD